MRRKVLIHMAMLGCVGLASGASATASDGASGGASDQKAGEPLPHVLVADIPPQVLTSGFLDAHPDLKFRRAGIQRDKSGNHAEARVQFEHAARYGDKPAQARLGEMYWNGEGGDRDRVQGFLWMALAAERGYREFAMLKQYYWQQLDATERTLASSHDQAMLAKYGDAAAKQRQDKVLRREGRRATGSMIGPTQQAKGITAFIGSRPVRIEAREFYAREYWTPDLYWQLQDQVWEQQFQGQVDVGDVETVTGPASEGDPGK